MSKIVGKTYKGQKDDEGLPHGHGTMEYLTGGNKKYKLTAKRKHLSTICLQKVRASNGEHAPCLKN